nr:hypothetical protein [Tanacetum cinerariifolium]
MSRANPHATITPEDQQVPRANRLVIKKKNQCVTSDSTITDTMMRFVIGILRHYKRYKLVSLTATEKKEENEKAKVFEEPEEQNVSPIRSGKGKGYTRSSENEANVPKLFKKNVVPRKTWSLTVVEERVAAEHATSKLKGPAVDDPAVQSLLDLRKGSKATRLESLKQKKKQYDLTDDNPVREMMLQANTTYLPIKTPQPSSLQAKAKKLMQKAKKNMRKINFEKAAAQKLRDYDEKLEALTNFNISKAFKKAIQARVLT